jgi:MoaA/NifB/PqqE/SkfB family radical SAM enzyme
VLKHVTLETTSRCNLRCIHCAFSKENNEGIYVMSDLPMEIFRKVLPALAKDKPIVELYGHGETLLHPHFFEMMEVLLDSGCSVSFLTNGQLLDDEKIEKIISKGVSLIGFSIDGATAGTYERIRRNAKFDLLINNIKKIDETKKRLGSDITKISISFVAMRQNINELPELVRLAHKIGASLVQVMELTEYNLTKGESLAYQQLLADWVDKAEAEAKSLGVQLDLPPHIPGREAGPSEMPVSSGKVIKTCKLPWESVFIRTTGAIQPCCVITEEYGELEDQDFGDIWYGRGYEDLRRSILDGNPPEPCLRCPYY